MRKALCSIGCGPYAELLAVAKPTFESYAERHHYELVTPAAFELDRPAPWAKVKLLRQLLDSFELVLWVDADAVVVDFSEDIAQALRADKDIGLVAHHRDGQLVPNSGVLVLRRGQVAPALLEEMWTATHLVDHPWWENAALCEALGYALPGSLQAGARGSLHRIVQRLVGRELRPFRRARHSPYMAHTQFLANEWNSIHGDRAPHPRIVHFLASPLPDRLAAMKAAVTASQGTV